MNKVRLPRYGCLPIVGHSGTGKTNTIVEIINTFYLHDKILIIGRKEDDESFNLLFAQKINFLKHSDLESVSFGEEDCVIIFDDLQAMPNETLIWIREKINTARHDRLLMMFTIHSFNDPKMTSLLNYIWTSIDVFVLTVHSSNSTLLAELTRKKTLVIKPALKKIIISLDKNKYQYIYVFQHEDKIILDNLTEKQGQ